MDCLDCHNRPAHHFRSPNDVVDLAVAAGRIDPALPWVKSNVVAALVQSYPTEAEAVQKSADTLRTKYPNAPQRDRLIAETQRLYTNNFFLEMRPTARVSPQ